jgi:glycosyltransferase involved in cell wall biosynthesis
MISGPEAHRVARSLESVAYWTSEIIMVLNEEVKDGTEKIAAQFGAKVSREPWKGYMAQKNSAAKKASFDWIFNLDADEVVSPELRDQMLVLFRDGLRLNGCAAINFPRLSKFCGRWIHHGDWYPDRQTRIWRRGKGKWTGVDPHPYVEVDGTTLKLTGNLEHYSTDSINSRLQKIIPFSDEFVVQHAGNGKRPGPFELALRPAWRFFRAYVVKLGFMDGWQGFYIASHTAFATLARYAKLRETLEARQK